MRLFGLIGHPLGHSFSQRFFTEKFQREGIHDARYALFPLPEIADFQKIVDENPDLEGLNVTIPHKEKVIPYLHGLDETAAAVGAVNCIRIRAGRLWGHNTDVHGFEQSLRRAAEAQPTVLRQTALVLGTGGASKAVAHVLGRMGLPFRFVSRQPAEGQLAYADLPALDFGALGLIVNTTPLGTYPDTEGCPPLPFEKISERHLIFDLVYNPPQTLLLQRAAAQGAAVQNGLEMLHLQAEKAWDIWQMPAT
jgi:shikimate dehydrogenase